MAGCRRLFSLALLFSVGTSWADKLCKASESVPFTSPATEDDRLFNAILPSELRRMDKTVGRYTRGRVPLYAGELEAKDNFAAFNSSGYDWNSSGAVVAAILDETFDSGAWKNLYVRFAGDADEDVSIRQQVAEPRTTEIQHWTWTSTCRDCLPRLAGAPAHIRVKLDAKGQSQHPGHTPALRLSLRGRLERVPWHKVSLEQIVTLDLKDEDGFLSLKDFRKSGGEYVLAGEGAHQDLELPAPSARFRGCHRMLNYSVTRFVDAQCPARYGIRDVKTTKREICCTDLSNGMGMSGSGKFFLPSCWPEGQQPPS